MKTLTLNSTCPCGHDIEFEAVRPKAMQATITKPLCSKCGSRFMVKLRKVGKKVGIDLKEIYLSPIAKEKVKAQILERQSG